ncbi:hypothetical protein KIN20_004617 [Parelaphostrongylus tenuis]|uniref:Uncharacterized protein n=1 Tax=Parelaphostrongylus tenuis TaxID=148309 RepID=A0AAD5MRM7_PARTN|nr:hypothetical protein KIN20_004617 [Parelaphostrongylus tenuis]
MTVSFMIELISRLVWKFYSANVPSSSGPTIRLDCLQSFVLVVVLVFLVVTIEKLADDFDCGHVTISGILKAVGKKWKIRSMDTTRTHSSTDAQTQQHRSKTTASSSSRSISGQGHRRARSSAVHT